MSGGSYDYLYLAETVELLRKSSDVERMAERLEELGYSDVAEQTRLVLSNLQRAIDNIDQYRERLNLVWHAVEWADSGDWSEAQARKTIEEHRQRKSHV